MTKTRMLLPLLVAGVLAVAGCNVKPEPPKLDGQRVSAIDVQTAEPGEQAAGQRVEDAYAGYLFALQTLEGYYNLTGTHFKREWARQEIENLEKSQTFHFVGVEPAEPGPAPDLTEVAEPVLVERTILARRAYLDAVNALVEHYEGREANFKAALARNILERFHPERTYRYYFDAEVPGPDLRPVRVYPEAERLFQQAKRLYDEGRIGPALTDYGKERRALLRFLELVEKYPDSTRIAESAYYIGYIYKEYFDEDLRGALWLERSFQWDPNIALPARYEAAVVTDYRLHNRSRAVELWREVLQHDPSGFHQDLARRRIEELTRAPAQ